MGMFRQLSDDLLLDPETLQLRGVPWGHVNYWWDGDGRDTSAWLMVLSAKLHVVWQLGETLRRGVVYETPNPFVLERFESREHRRIDDVRCSASRTPRPVSLCLGTRANCASMGSCMWCGTCPRQSVRSCVPTAGTAPPRQRSPTSRTARRPMRTWTPSCMLAISPTCRGVRYMRTAVPSAGNARTISAGGHSSGRCSVRCRNSLSRSEPPSTGDARRIAAPAATTEEMVCRPRRQASVDARWTRTQRKPCDSDGRGSVGT